MCENFRGACLNHEWNFHLISCPQTPRSVWRAFSSHLLFNVQWSAGALSMDNRDQLKGRMERKGVVGSLFTLNWTELKPTPSTIKGWAEKTKFRIINIDKEYFNFWIAGSSSKIAFHCTTTPTNRSTDNRSRPRADNRRDIDKVAVLSVCLPIVWLYPFRAPII